MSDNTSAKVEEIRERLAVIGATRPWHSIKDNDGEIGAYDDCGEPLPRGPEDVNFIAHAPEDIAFLLAKVERLTADLAQTRAAAREQLAEKDRIIDEVMGEMEALRDMGREGIGLLTREVERLELRNALIEGWEMPKPPGPRLEAAAWRVPDVGWVTQWVTHFGGSTPHEIPSPFRDGVRPTVEMFRALGFVTYE